jgi:hypothetical protein
MYPNIPRERAHEILGKLAEKTHVEADFVKKLLSWSDNFLAFRHQDKIFYQRDGLAMGIPAAPDVANLYMSHFEDSFATNPRFVLYKRYIDDIFCLVKASSADEALDFCKATVKADGLEFTWSVDKKTINFLDLQITQEAGYLSFRPYRKPLNSYERLPFTSYHPLLVKRAAFCGEVSRIARVCSKYSTYYKEIEYVRDIYLKRGYPGELLYNWISAEARNRWDTRYKDAPEGEEVSALWLKSEYNNVWQHIDLRDVWSAMVDGRDISKSPFGHIQRIMLSLQKFRNLGEINNKYNADVLRASRVEEDVVLLEQRVDDGPPRNDSKPPPPQVVKFGANPQMRINFPKV